LTAWACRISEMLQGAASFQHDATLDEPAGADLVGGQTHA